MERIYIIGGSGFAKEVCNLIFLENKYEIAGFIDLTPETDYITYNENAIPIIAESDFLLNEEYKNSSVVVGVGDPLIISKIFQKYSAFNFPNIISDNAIVGNDVILGKGNIITQGVIFTTSISIGDGNIFNLSSTIGHDVEIGNYNVINPSVNISGGVSIGNGNLFGVGSIILQYLKIIDNNVIGGASLVTKSVESKKVIVGIPGKEKI